MQNNSNPWTALSAGRRVFVILATIAVFAAVLALARGAGTKDTALLFGGLEPRAAGDVITSLDQRGVYYEVRGNGIYVPTGQRDNLRMALAGEGLPATGSQGYELLDSLSGFSTTSQMFDAAYWRAKEGELARTILASHQIRSARVHISTPSNRPFQREQIATASVTVSTAGGSISASHVKALQYLVGAAVPGLSPDSVAIIDVEGGLLSGVDGPDTNQASEDRAANLRQKAERLLAARVGVGNAVVEVSVDTVTETESITERRVDPESRVAISTDVLENAGTSSDSRGGDVTVASNLPDGDAGGGGGASNSENTESRSLTNYEVSETERQLVRAAGAVKRLTVAVLINEATVLDENGNAISTPRSEVELASLQELVASAVGIDPERGDIITLKSMVFEPIPSLGTEIASPAPKLPLDTMQLIQIAVLALVSLVLGLFVVRPILTQSQQLAVSANTETLEDLSDSGPQMAMAIGDDSMGDFMGGDMGGELGGMGGGMGIGGGLEDDPVSRLRNMIADRETETIQILQDWIEDPETKEQA